MEMKKFAICYNQEISHSIEIKDKLYSILASKGIYAEILNIDNLKAGLILSLSLAEMEQF